MYSHSRGSTDFYTYTFAGLYIKSSTPHALVSTRTGCVKVGLEGPRVFRAALQLLAPGGLRDLRILDTGVMPDILDVFVQDVLHPRLRPVSMTVDMAVESM